MRVIAWCLLLIALIFAAKANRLDDNAFNTQTVNKAAVTPASIGAN